MKDQLYQATAVVMMPIMTVMSGMTERVRRAEQDKDSGAGVVEWVMITAVVVLIVGVVAAIIRDEVVDRARTIDTNWAP